MDDAPMLEGIAPRHTAEATTVAAREKDEDPPELLEPPPHDDATAEDDDDDGDDNDDDDDDGDDNDNDDNDDEPMYDDKSFTSSLATPLKLQVSATEDEEEDSTDGAAVSAVSAVSHRLEKRKHLRLLSPGSQRSDVEALVAVLLKRKRYTYRRSGSSDWLLGFDEGSGIPEFEKKDAAKTKSSKSPATTAAAAAPPPPLPTTTTTTISAKEIVDKPVAAAAAAATSPIASPPHIVADNDVASSAEQPTTRTKQNARNKTATPSPTATPTPTPTATPVLVPSAAAAAAVASTPTPPALPTSPTSQAKPKPLSAQDDYYKKPFDFGWKRELVWRANIETSKDKADVYFIAPSGKKLRTRSDIMPLLEGELTIDHFCFSREPLGAAAEYETVRSAKPTSRATIAAATLAAASSTPTTMGKRISKPKGPKGASPPPQGWTPTRALKVNNAALLSSSTAASRYSSGSAGTPSQSPSGRSGPTAGSETKKSKSKKLGGALSTSGENAASKTTANSMANSSSANANANSMTAASTAAAASPPAPVPMDISTESNRPNNRSTTANVTTTTTTASPATARNATTPTAATTPASAIRTRTHEPCTVKCTKAAGQMPQLQCVKCVCLYHHECVGLTRQGCEYRTVNTSPRSPPAAAAGTPGAPPGRDYICEACAPKVKESPPSRKSVEAHTNSAASPVHVRSPRPVENKFPQTLTVVKGKKYVMVAKPVVLHTEHTNDIENDLKQINESIRNNRKLSSASLDAVYQTHNAAAVAAAVEQSNKVAATKFFANASCAYTALICIFKYLKMHERPRAASVCKLWNVASKDTSLWHTVRMKNSKVCDWAGFAAALRRGETKHLDLRKMLLASTRSDEMWQDFSHHIGTVCTLETIDLCRCSARVVEDLFRSNKHLRVLNAVTIIDESLNLEHVALLQELRELRLRTMEPAVLGFSLQSLQTLKHLSHLSLTAVRGLGKKSVELLADLVELRSLELGECGDFDDTFATIVLSKLVNLQRLRLENGQETGCCTLAILEAAGRLDKLSQLELVNFDIKPGFEEKLCQCVNLRKLLIIPTYISQSATTNHIVLSAVQQVADTLEVFTWGVTVELLRVTALYVGQCEESTKKEKYLFDECIPVLKPVPGAPPADESDTETASQQSSDVEPGTNVVPQIEILPLDKVETILGDNLPHTKFTIVKVLYTATCKQQLVE